MDCADGTDEMNCGNFDISDKTLIRIRIRIDSHFHFQSEDHFKNLFFDHTYRKNPAAQLDDVNVGECGKKK